MEKNKGWWFASIKINLPNNENPNWHIDLYVAHKIIMPILIKYKQYIKLWRVHRRAKHDEKGHQFSLIFYSSQEYANIIYNEISKNEYLVALKNANIVSQEIFDDTSKIQKPNIEDTCYPNWSIQIKKSWPYYIMGASKMWLDLIEMIAIDFSNRLKDNDIQKQLEVYRAINDKISKLWQNEGSHSLLHHLNAIFGYAPIAITETRHLQF